MQVVGVDFGTTNVRIATWDSSQQDQLPEPHLIGQGDASTMPAVIAFQREPGGAVSTIVGEDADRLDDGPNTLVVRNIKRWALAGDPFVRGHLESRGAPWPTWWDPERRTVSVWGERYPVKEIIRKILAEAFQRANLSGEYEWRAGCPVHAGLDYRSDLAEVLSGFGGVNSVASVIEEPVLFLVLAHTLDKLPPGSHLVYDVGGGSFDCALAEVESDGRMIVYASHGNPLLGGVTIDESLTTTLNYEGPSNLLRIAKEKVTPSNPIQRVNQNTSVSLDDIKRALIEERFVAWTVVAMREAYITAKVIWKRLVGDSPIGGIPQCRLGDLPEAFGKDIDTIILTGGPTKATHFRDRLEEQFGVGGVKAASDLVPDVLDPELTGLSMGACYVSAEHHNPLYVSRLPVRVTLTHTKTGDQVAYEPYRHFADDFNPAKPYVSPRLPPQAGADAEYKLTVTDAGRY